jgi:hypothetical protein
VLVASTTGDLGGPTAVRVGDKFGDPASRKIGFDAASIFAPKSVEAAKCQDGDGPRRKTKL